MRLRHSINSYEHESFYAAYRLEGKLYQDKEIENADEYSHELSFGSSYFRQEDNRTRRVFSAFTIAQTREYLLRSRRRHGTLSQRDPYR